MSEAGFVEAKSDNLPVIDAFMMSAFLAENPDYVSAEIRGVKSERSKRECYGDAAVGFVQLKRDGNICVVKGRITPEHNVRKKGYTVTVVCNEEDETIVSIQCGGCAAQLGGCKHAIAFLAWLHRRSEDPSPTSVQCYWRKSKLSTIGTSLNFIKAKDLGRRRSETLPSQQRCSFLRTVTDHCRGVGQNTSTQLMKYYKECSNVEKLSLHYLVNSLPQKPALAQEFIAYCGQRMDPPACKEVERATLNQSDNPLWHELRYARITASKAYEAAHCQTVDGTLTESIMGARKLRDTEAMKRGRRLEKEALKVVEEKLGVQINECGLRLDPACPVMGASPDGVTEEYCIEIKCPFSKKAMGRYIDKGNKILPRYNAQIQIQMHFLKKEKGLFCVAHHDFEKSREVNIFEVNYDRDFCQQLIKKCLQFWGKAVYPLL